MMYGHIEGATGGNYDEKLLKVQQYVSSVVVGHQVFNQHTDVVGDYVKEALGFQFTAVMRAPAEVLMDRAVIAEYPSSWWENFKVPFRSLAIRLGVPDRYRPKVRMNQVRLSEHLVYPDLSWQDPNNVKVRMFTQTDRSQFTYGLDD